MAHRAFLALSTTVIVLACDEPQPAEPDPCLDDFVLATQQDVDAISRCSRVGGDVVVASKSLSTLDLPALEVVDGDVVMFDRYPCGEDTDDIACGEGTPIETVSLPALVSIGGQLQVGLAGVSAFELPSVVSIGGAHVRLPGPQSTFDLAALETIDADLRIESNVGGAVLDLPSVRSVGGSVLIDSGTLSRIRMAALVSVGDELTLTRNEDLVAIELPLLREILGPLNISENGALPAVDLPELQAIGSAAGADGYLNILRNISLTTLRLPKLSALGGSLLIKDNPSLATCQAEAVADRLRANGHTGPSLIEGNDEFGTCQL